MAVEPKETLDKYQQDLFEKFISLEKEELIQKLISYEFGKLLKKYASVEDLNLSDEERHEGKRSRRESRQEESRYEFTTFSVNVGREDGFTPRDLMAIINANTPRKGIEIGGIRIFERNTKFEVDIRGIDSFMSHFRNVNFNGLPFVLSEVRDRYNSERGGRREYGGGKRNATANNKWRSENRRSDGSSRGRFGEKKKGKKRG